MCSLHSVFNHTLYNQSRVAKSDSQLSDPTAEKLQQEIGSEIIISGDFTIIYL